MADHVALITGVGPSLGAALGRRFAAAGMRVAVAARGLERLEAIATDIDGATAFACDVTDEAAVAGLVSAVESRLGPIEVAIHNARAAPAKASILDMEADALRHHFEISALGGFLVGREAARVMVPRGRGAVLFTGATASLRGGSGFAAFAQGKFALRAIAQSMARELGPKGIHVAHFIIDGGIGDADDDSRMKPDAIAETYFRTYAQDRSSWAFEVDLRPWTENF
jgi:NAD(P)-dependent dehydrogenase (short-subunit alcohol dehydrogenase family)